MEIWAKWVEGDGRFSFSLDDNGGTSISAERHGELLRAEAAGQVLVPGEGGTPNIVDPVLTEEAAREIERRWRTAGLSHHEWVVTRHRDEVELGVAPTLSDEQYAEMLVYRQALRDWPAADAFPVEAGRPTAPQWLTELTK
ncbi:phage tail assembly chaperone [Pseudomonas soli]|uniref:Phage tail protein n=1 Tax=Pseudomonas soli TaxID=1306993 RepID=A0A2V4I414_9PSED|nr:phage tail assembly chaperone [Pseudomonas soli]PYB85208.1 phage tail protein [Pseudomonas soli]